MRIGLFTTDFPFRAPFTLEDQEQPEHQWGGVAEVVYHLAMSLGRQGHTVKVFTTSPTSRDIVQESGQVTIFRYGKDVQVASTILSTELLWKPLQHDLDVVHGHLGTPPGAYAALAYSRVKRKPLVVTVHTTYDAVSLKGGSSARRFFLLLFTNVLCSPLLRTADAITAVSSPVMEGTTAYREFIPRASIIPNGVSIADLRGSETKEECRRRLGIGGERLVVLCVGSLSPYKDPQTLLGAFGKMRLGGVEPYLVMLGDGPLRGALEEYSRKGGFSDRVRMPGFVSEEDKLLYYGAADVFAIPSLGDAFGLVLLEAAAFGLLIIASDLEVFRSIIKDGHNGLIFRKGEESDLLDKLETVRDDENARMRMGANARETALQYDWPTVLREYFQIYQDLIGARGARTERR